MSSQRKTAIVTGASQGIGAGVVKAFVERGFNVVANSRKVTQSAEVAASDHVALVDGHIGEPATAAKVVETALSRFQYEWHNDSGRWFRSYGNELWEFDDDGLMRRREASINDVPMAESDRKFFWPAPGPRPADHPGIPDVA